MARGLERLEGQVGGERPADEIGDGCGEGVEKVEEADKEDYADEGIRLGDLRALLKVDKDGVLGELE